MKKLKAKWTMDYEGSLPHCFDRNKAGKCGSRNCDRDATRDAIFCIRVCNKCYEEIVKPFETLLADTVIEANDNTTMEPRLDYDGL